MKEIRFKMNSNNLNNITKIQENVFVHNGEISILNKSIINYVINAAKESPLKRARINFHQSDHDSVHEMIIAMTNETIVYPHKHVNKVESFHVIQGIVRVGFIDEEGNVTKVIQLDNEHYPFYRLNAELWHVVIPISKHVIIHEVTNGPFIKGKSSIFPKWFTSKNGTDKINLIRDIIKSKSF